MKSIREERGFQAASIHLSNSIVKIPRCFFRSVFCSFLPHRISWTLKRLESRAPVAVLNPQENAAKLLGRIAKLYKHCELFFHPLLTPHNHHPRASLRR
jgi:hypothetical protein